MCIAAHALLRIIFNDAQAEQISNKIYKSFRKLRFLIGWTMVCEQCTHT